jgi:serine/threonine protein kinase
MSENANLMVGDYRLEKTIGQGTYGKVKLGIHMKTNEKVAVKIIEKSQLQSQKQIARLQREIRFLKLLYHPHIVKVYDVIETTECIYIVMEYAVGGELFDYIVAHKRVKEKEARAFFRMVLSAVDYCHKNSVIHRDLKPENLLLDETKSIKIIDFGFGNTYIENGYLDTFCGSPFYAAPEMILGKKYEGPEVDMWSLGVILFALLCGHLPFDDANMKELYKKIASGTYTVPDYLMPDARHLISRLITVDPHKRATLDEVMHHRWVNEGYSHPPSNYMPIRPVIRDEKLLDQDIIKRLSHFGYKREDVIKAFVEADPSRPHPIRSTYWLLYEMLQREERKARERKAQHHHHHQMNNNQKQQQQQQQQQQLQQIQQQLKNQYRNIPDNNDQKSAENDMEISDMKINQNIDNELNTRNAYAKKNSEAIKANYNVPSQSNYADRDEYSKLYPEQCNNNKCQMKNQEIIRNQNNYNNQSCNNRPSSQNQQYSSIDSRRLSDGYKINSNNVNKPGIDPYMCISIGNKYEKQYTSQPIETETANGQFIQKPPMISPNTNNRIQKLFNSTPQGSSNIGCYNISTDSSRINNQNINSYSVSIPCQLNSIKPNKLDIKYDSELINANQPESASPVLEHGQLPKIGNYDYNMMYNGGIKSNGYQNQLESDSIKDGRNEYEEPCRRHSLPTFSTYNQQRKNSITSKAKEEIRTVSGWFINVSATSNKPLQEIIYEITRVLQVNNIPHYYDGNSTFECECLDVNDFLDQNDSGSLLSTPPNGNNHERDIDDSDGKNGKKNKNNLRFQIEICHIPRLASYGLHFKRLYGGVWNYKKICTKHLSQMSI